ncbi:MAG: NAD(P)-dependent oxidoreductase, partial [Spirochaetaceae bacterium]|nr:NAD(P)-dependent oxidoreductase [Spirochaetaceae bacterium]
MFKVLITGAFGNVGRSAVSACRYSGDDVTILEFDSPRNRKTGRILAAQWERSGPPPRIIYGDVRDSATVDVAVAGQDAVIHLAALIPPAADAKPELARSINVEGTRVLAEACMAEAAGGGRPPRFVLASSIAAYGDRVANPWIAVTDRLVASPGDAYAASKIEAEALVRGSGLPFCVLRLTYIVWRKKLRRDPLMFHMPLRTKIEVCHTEDTGRAFAAAAREDEALGRTFDIGGGESCRTTYREYLDSMLKLFGLGGIAFLPEEAFATEGFHCGWYADSDDAERVLRFRRKTLADYYGEVAEEAFWLRLGAAFAGPII